MASLPVPDEAVYLAREVSYEANMYIKEYGPL